MADIEVGRASFLLAPCASNGRLPQSFLKLLDTTVRAPRLSGTKTKQLAQDSVTIPNSHDTKVVSTFLKLNNSLAPACQQRISSLYVFDAIARENKKVAGKEGFMSKMEGVVESWVRGMVDNGKGGVWTEGRVSACLGVRKLCGVH